MPIVRQIRISSLVISLASPSPQRMQYQPVLESNPQIVPLYCCVLICCDWGVREEWVYTETMIGRLLSRYCVLSLLQSGRGGFSAWSSTFRLWVQVDASLVARDRGPSSVSGYFLFQVVPRGLNLVLLELCNKWEGGGQDKDGSSCVERQDAVAPYGQIFYLVGVIGLAGLRTLYV